MHATLTRAETWSLLALSGACATIIANAFQGDGEPLIASLACAGLAFASTYAFIRWAGPAFIARGHKGRDMSKLKPKDM